MDKDLIASTRDALHPEYVTHGRRRLDQLSGNTLEWDPMPPVQPAPCLIDQLEIVAVIGEGFQLKWIRQGSAKGLKVGDKLFAFIRPDEPNDEEDRTRAEAKGKATEKVVQQ